jgi:hypothetical protein
MIPRASVSHKTSERLRIRIPSKKGDAGYFALLGQLFSSAEGLCERAEVNVFTGSMLLNGKGMNTDAVSEYAQKNGLFALDFKAPNEASLASKVVGPLREASGYLGRVTKGEVDLANLAFIALIGAGLYQIFRGNIKAPPWYTAFWYAMGVFLKSISEKEKVEA